MTLLSIDHRLNDVTWRNVTASCSSAHLHWRCFVACVCLRVFLAHSLYVPVSSDEATITCGFVLASSASEATRGIAQNLLELFGPPHMHSITSHRTLQKRWPECAKFRQVFVRPGLEIRQRYSTLPPGVIVHNIAADLLHTLWYYRKPQDYHQPSTMHRFRCYICKIIAHPSDPIPTPL